MKRVPEFAGQNRLSLSDLQALADAVSECGAAPVTVPAAPRVGRAMYGSCNYNVEDACNGEVGVVDGEGLLASVEFKSGLSAPRVNEGAMELPMASEGVAGGLRGVRVEPSLYCPALVDGELLLPAGGGGSGEWPVLTVAPSSSEVWSVKNGRIEVGLADDCDGCAGVIRRVEMSADVTGPRLRQGVLMLPMGGGAGGGSALSGMVTSGGVKTLWADMVDAPVHLCYVFVDGVRFYLTGQVVDGFLKIDTEG